MASRTPARSRSRERSRSSSGSSAQPFVLGGVGLAVVIVLVVMMQSGGTGTARPAGGGAPANSAASASAAPIPVKLEASKSGSAPKRPAPPLSEATLQQARDLLTAAKGYCNEGITARTAGDNTKARERQSLAKDKIDELKKLVAAQSLWQEEAQLGDWAQPAEYVTLEKLLGELGPLEKRVRMGGGT